MKKILFEGPIFTRSGYGRRSWDIALALIKSEKYQVWIFPTRWGSTPPIDLDLENEDHRLIKDCVRQQINEEPDIHIQITIPNEFRPLAKNFFGITAGIETTGCPKEWIDGLNRTTATFCSSNHSVNVFKNVKFEKKNHQGQVEQIIQTTKPLEWLFEGIDTKIYNKNNIVEFNSLDEVKEKWCYLVCGHYLQGSLGHDRKDIGMTIKTFYDVFKNKAPQNRPALVLKSSGAGFSITERDVIIDKIHQIQEMVRSQGFQGQFPNVYLLNGDLTDEEMNSLYNHPKIKAMVSFTKGEGWGRPLLEFTMTGKPVICSNWSGPVDFLNKDFAFLLPGKLDNVDRSAQNEWIVRDSQWFTVNYQFAGQVLKDVYENYEKYLEKSRKHIKFTKDNFSLEKMQERLVELIEKYTNQEPKRMQLKLPQLKKVT